MKHNFKSINGPINIVRLEGKFKNINKVLYVMMDFHIDVCHQTKCENIFSKNISTYLAENFYKLNNSNKKYDFFFEISDKLTEFGQKIVDDETKYNYKYIHEIVVFFNKLRTNKNSINDIIKNVRVHYIDIRNYFEYQIYTEISKIWNIIDNIRSDNSLETINTMKECLENMSNFLNDLIKIIANPNIENEVYKVFCYLIKKIKEKYNYSEIKSYINKELNIISNELSDLIKDIHNINNKIQTQWNDIIDSNNKNNILIKNNFEYSYGVPYIKKEKIIVEMTEDINILEVNIIHIFCKIMDIFFIRRFLDKDYITNGILYTGAFHSLFYIHALCKIFNFKVTHYDYSKIENLEELNKQIKKLKYTELSEIFFKPVLSQCSDMSHFPENFN